MNNEIALRRTLAAIIGEYEAKEKSIPVAMAAFTAAGNDLKTAATIGGQWGDVSINTGSVYERDLTRSLLRSAWRHMYEVLNIGYVATATDKRKFESSIAAPPEFTFDNIVATFGHYLEDPRNHILRGLAEAFCNLDPIFKSHEKMKIGVKGLPKRVILRNVGSYGSWGTDYLRDAVNALCAVMDLPLLEWNETRVGDRVAVYGLRQLLDDGMYMHASHGIELRRYQNGNGHLIFEPETLRAINLGLAEFYGDVLPDAVDKGTVKPQASTDVAKDLQFYPTPPAAIDALVRDYEYQIRGKRVLEPSCGDGRLMDAAREAGAAEVFGIEVDPRRAQMARQKGHNVLTANFLDVPADQRFDVVLMNPPFYGRHYALHVQHALGFLKPDGLLRSILPITAIEHGLVKGRFDDLPIGSFRESGTNINTTIFTTTPNGRR